MAVNDVEVNDNLLYPNPIKDHFIIQNSQGSTLTVYNSAGTLLMNKQIISDKQSIEMNQFNSI